MPRMIKKREPDCVAKAYIFKWFNLSQHDNAVLYGCVEDEWAGAGQALPAGEG